MSARANWHTIDLDKLVAEEGELDPFSAPVEEVGEPIDLGKPEDRLYVRLQRLLDREQSLYKNDVTCPIKDAPGTSCLACPVSEHTDFDSRLGMLCRVGRDQEKVNTELVAIACRPEKNAH